MMASSFELRASSFELRRPGVQDSGAPTGVVEPDDTVLVMYTSGTTGRPKGVVLTHRSVNVHSAVSNAGSRMVPGDVNMVGMPMFPVGGSCYFQVRISAGAQTIYLRDPAGPSMMNAIAEGATHAFFVPVVI